MAARPQLPAARRSIGADAPYRPELWNAASALGCEFAIRLRWLDFTSGARISGDFYPALNLRRSCDDILVGRTFSLIGWNFAGLKVFLNLLNWSARHAEGRSFS
jgi:hypothetical protein